MYYGYGGYNALSCNKWVFQRIGFRPIFENFFGTQYPGKLLAPQLTGAIREFSLYTTVGCASFSLSLLSASLFYATGFSALCALFVLNICKFSRCKIKVVAFATFKNKGGCETLKLTSLIVSVSCEYLQIFEKEHSYRLLAKILAHFGV